MGDFAEIPELRGSATVRNIRSPVYCKGVDQKAGNAWVHCITPESLVVGNREDPKNDPSQPKARRRSLDPLGNKASYSVRHTHKNSNDAGNDNKY